MKKSLLSLSLLGVCIITNAQVGIGTNDPKATLDVRKSTITSTTAVDGVIAPNMTKIELANKALGTYGTAQTGAMVYVTTINTVASEPSVLQVGQITTIGYYTFNGTVWIKLLNATDADTTNDAWVNNSTNTRVELGTTSTGTARTTTNSVVVTDAGRLGIGTGILFTDIPDAGLHVVGDGDGWKDDIRLDSYGGNATTAPAANFRMYGARGTKAAPSAVQAGDTLGQFNFWYYGSSGFATGAKISSNYRSTTGSDLIFSTGGPSNSTMIMTETGNIGIGGTPVTNKLEVYGTASKTTPGDWLGNSDERLKKDIAMIPQSEALNKLLQLKGVYYYWNDTKTGITRPTEKQIGFIAQDIQKVFPDKVTTDSKGYLQTAYGDYDAIVVEAIRALNDKITKLEEKVTTLEKENVELKQKK